MKFIAVLLFQCRARLFYTQLPTRRLRPWRINVENGHSASARPTGQPRFLGKAKLDSADQKLSTVLRFVWTWPHCVGLAD